MLVMVRKIRGTTSACAENTPKAAVTVLALRNYLRVRGEYLLSCYVPTGFEELPPRARRIPDRNHYVTYVPRNYLRVRGEYPK